VAHWVRRVVSILLDLLVLAAAGLVLKRLIAAIKPRIDAAAMAAMAMCFQGSGLAGLASLSPAISSPDRITIFSFHLLPLFT